mmetsp:Transcript_17278/g.28887  ORF Transcript_17278/g.28887 Transcript_17278/m.28887 type:complete len:226 (+) Transcript_17278:105-782(+)
MQWSQDVDKSQNGNPLLSEQEESSSGSYRPPNWIDDSNASSEEDPMVPKMILYTRLINLALSVLLIIISLLSILTTTDITSGVLACYVVLLSCMLCCYETHLKQVSKVIATNFGFLYSAKARCLFFLFIGSIMFHFGFFGTIMGLAMIANAGFNAYVLVKHPTFEQAQRTNAQSEISEFLAANPAWAQKAVSMGLSAAATTSTATSPGPPSSSGSNGSEPSYARV